MLELVTDTRIDLARSAARHGTGLFETIRIHRGRALRLNAHLARLARGAAFLGMDAPPETNVVRAFVEQHTNCAQLSSGVLRLLTVDERLIVFISAWEPSRAERIDIGVAARIVRLSSSPLNRFKTMAYLENTLLTREAKDRAMFEVVALNEAGRLTDGGRTTLFVVSEDRVVTPPVADGALPGIARDVLLQAGLATEVSLRPADLLRADGAFLTNALHGVVTVDRVEGGTSKNSRHPKILAATALLNAD
jgi:branched-chain amino acid aminotransferase